MAGIDIPLEVARDHKFAVLALPEARGGGSPHGLLAVDAGFAVSAGLPAGSLETWATDIGAFHQRELSDCRLFLWTIAPSKSSAILDEENQRLQNRVLRLHIGLLLAVPNFSCGRITYLGGANSDGTARVRTLTTYQRACHTVGSPESALTVRRLRFAAELATALEAHDQYRFSERMMRAIRTFREGCESRYADDKLHQFVRCSEAFAGSRDYKQFVARLSRLCIGRHRVQLRQMYKIRSATEHLQGPYGKLSKKLPKTHKHLVLLARCIEAEALARYLLVTYLLDRRLWPHFRSRGSVSAFWALAPREISALWPEPFNYVAIARSFNLEAARDDMEGA